MANAVDKVETEFQSKMEEFYVKLHESSFRAMRRFTPKQGKMTWRINAHSLADEIGGA